MDMGLQLRGRGVHGFDPPPPVLLGYVEKLIRKINILFG